MKEINNNRLPLNKKLKLNFLNNKYLKFKKDNIAFVEHSFKYECRLPEVYFLFYKKMEEISKLFFFLKKCYNFKKNRKFYLLRKGANFKLFKKFFKINFLKFWIMRYKFINIFYYKLISDANDLRMFKNRLERRRKKKKVKFLYRKKRNYFKKKKFRKHFFKKQLFEIFFNNKDKYKRRMFRIRKFKKRFKFKWNKVAVSKSILFKYILKSNIFIRKIARKKISSYKVFGLSRMKFLFYKLKKNFKFRKKKLIKKKILNLEEKKQLESRICRSFNWDKKLINTKILNLSTFTKKVYKNDFFSNNKHSKSKRSIKNKRWLDHLYELRDMRFISDLKKYTALPQFTSLRLQRFEKYFYRTRKIRPVYQNAAKSFLFAKNVSKLNKLKKEKFNAFALSPKIYNSVLKIFSLLNLCINKIFFLYRKNFNLKIKDKMFRLRNHLLKLIKYVNLKNYFYKKYSYNGYSHIDDSSLYVDKTFKNELIKKKTKIL